MITLQALFFPKHNWALYVLPKSQTLQFKKKKEKETTIRIPTFIKTKQTYMALSRTSQSQKTEGPFGGVI